MCSPCCRASSSAPVAARLGKFVLRAKVRLQDESAQWIIEGALASAAPDTEAHGAGPGGPRRDAARGRRRASCAARHAPARFLLIRARRRTRDARRTGAAWARGLAAGGHRRRRAAGLRGHLGAVCRADAQPRRARTPSPSTRAATPGRRSSPAPTTAVASSDACSASAPARRVQLRPGDAGTLADGRAFKVVEAVRGTRWRCRVSRSDRPRCRRRPPRPIAPGADAGGERAAAAVRAAAVARPF